MNPLSLQPIPYQGSKRQLAPRICALFPRDIDTIYEPFAGSAAITIYAAHRKLAKRFVIGDVYPELVRLWDLIINKPGEVSASYRSLWNEQFTVGDSHFNHVRALYNHDRDPAKLCYLIARCVKNAIRFNRQGNFTQSVDKRRTGMKPDKFEETAHAVSTLLQGRTRLFCGDFRECVASASRNDLVYMDPPYQGTTYGRDKRYAAQTERQDLVEGLAELNRRDVPFVLSYDGKTGDREYGEKLPDDLELSHLYINAGRSSQSTLSGRSELTLESLYISCGVAAGIARLPDYERMVGVQSKLFA